MTAAQPKAWPQPTREDHERFCQAEGWERVREAKGRTGTHHVTYELARMERPGTSHPDLAPARPDGLRPGYLEPYPP